MADQWKSCRDTLQCHLINYDRLEAVQYALSLLENGTVTVPELYEQILAPSLNSILVSREAAYDMIWREHVMTGIVRGVVESALPYVLKERNQHRLPGFTQKVMLACPEEEYHELGLRMGADFYTIAGYDVVFIGSNTPKHNILSAAKHLQPDIIGIGVSNYLNLIQLDWIIPKLRQEMKQGVKIYLGGSAFKHTGRTHQDFQADGIVNTFDEILALRGHAYEDRV